MKSPLYALSSRSMKEKSNQALHIVSLLLEDYNYLHAGLFCMLFCRLKIFFKLTFFKKILQEYYQSIKQFRIQIRLDDLGLNCLQMLSVDNSSHD